MAKELKQKERTIKFDVFPAMEYFDLTKNAELLIRLNADQCNKISKVTRAQAQTLLYTMMYEKHGAKYPPGFYHYQFKEPGSTRLERGKIRLIADDSLEIKKDDNLEQKQFENQLAEIKKQIAKISDSGTSNIDIITSALKLGHEAQVSFLNMQLTDKDNKIKELKDEIEHLEKLLDKAEQTLSETDTTGMASKILDGLSGLMKTKATPVNYDTLQDQTGSIPVPLFDLLNSIDWLKVSPQDLDKTMNDLNMYVAAKGFPKK